MISQEAILERVMQFIGQLVPSEMPIGPNTDLLQDLGLDSVKMMDLVMELEDEFDISIPINILMDVRTPEHLADTIVTLMEKQKYGAL